MATLASQDSAIYPRLDSTSANDVPNTVKFVTQFVKPGVSSQTWLGFPKSIFSCKELCTFIRLATQYMQAEVVLHDARKVDLDFKKCGFCLMPLKSEVKDWAAASIQGSPVNLVYQEELTKIVKQLYPECVKVTFTSFLLRGGEGENGPAAGGIHLDIYPDQVLYEEWQVENGINWEDTYPDLDLGVILGMWKPRNDKNPVLDFPLFCLDATTHDPKDFVPQHQKFYQIAEGKPQLIVNTAGALKYNERQKWYYYPEQTNEEVLVFSHSSVSDPNKVNYHAAAPGLVLPEGAQTRMSIETRAMLFFPKGTVKQPGKLTRQMSNMAPSAKAKDH